MVETSENVYYSEVLYKNLMLKTTYRFINQKWGGLEFKKGKILTIPREHCIISGYIMYPIFLTCSIPTSLSFLLSPPLNKDFHRS